MSNLITWILWFYLLSYLLKWIKNIKCLKVRLKHSPPAHYYLNHFLINTARQLTTFPDSRSVPPALTRTFSGAVSPHTHAVSRLTPRSLPGHLAPSPGSVLPLLPGLVQQQRPSSSSSSAAAPPAPPAPPPLSFMSAAGFYWSSSKFLLLDKDLLHQRTHTHTDTLELLLGANVGADWRRSNEALLSTSSSSSSSTTTPPPLIQFSIIFIDTLLDQFIWWNIKSFFSLQLFDFSLIVSFMNPKTTNNKNNKQLKQQTIKTINIKTTNHKNNKHFKITNYLNNKQ